MKKHVKSCNYRSHNTHAREGGAGTGTGVGVGFPGQRFKWAARALHRGKNFVLDLGRNREERCPSTDRDAESSPVKRRLWK